MSLGVGLLPSGISSLFFFFFLVVVFVFAFRFVFRLRPLVFVLAWPVRRLDRNLDRGLDRGLDLDLGPWPV